MIIVKDMYAFYLLLACDGSYHTLQYVYSPYFYKIILYGCNNIHFIYCIRQCI